MSARSRDLPRRSCLSVPASSERFLEKGPTVPADMTFLDLEDAVAPLEKEGARAKFRILAEALGPGGRAAVLCEGRDVYGLTARFLVAAAQKVSGAGAMAPAEALDPVPFFVAVTYEDEHGAFSWRRL